ncbi:MAG: hypothetical protein ACE5DI_06070 [Candidatus Micrarchaeia archaeon]
MNAFSGELNDFVSLLFERPLKKSRKTSGGESEVEQSSISLNEAKEAAQAKVASQLGVSKEAVSISAVSKFYVPFYRVWVNTALGQYKLDVDGCLGAPLGVDGVVSRQKTWNEETNAALNKLKSPSGWADLFGRLFSSAGKSGKDAGPSFLKSKPAVWGILILFILLFFSLGFFGGGQKEVSCSLDSGFVKQRSVFFFFKEDYVSPKSVVGNRSLKFVEGVCSLTSKSRVEQPVCVRHFVRAGDSLKGSNSSCAVLPAYDSSVNQTILKSFRVEWEQKGTSTAYEYEFSE